MAYPIAYAAINQDAAVRNSSSSGGVFYLLAEDVIRRGGVVFGARYDDNWEVVHDFTEDAEGIAAFMGSKYVQSRVADTYSQARTFLQQGRTVLFSGTPCQIYGLKAYLGKDYENLITTDLICHGVPSPKVWRAYLQLRAQGRKIKAISFRDKTQSWQRYSLKIDFSNGEKYQVCSHDDLYMKGFLQDIYLRPSCYNCRFKTAQRVSDMTLADLWGCRTLAPEMFDDKGTSLVLIQSEKGAEIWERICANMRVCQLQNDDYRKFNKSLTTSVEKTGKYHSFYKGTSWQNLEKLTSRKASLPARALRKAKRVIKKLIKRV